MKQKKSDTPQDAYYKAERYCALQERCIAEVRAKFYEWEVAAAEGEKIIEELLKEDFINEERFATVFARGKFRIKKWGKIKIKYALGHFNIPSPYINNALKEINNSDYKRALEKIITDKSKMVKAASPALKKKKLLQYALSKGYESELVWEVLGFISSKA